MNTLSDKYQINCEPMLAPDEDVEMSLYLSQYGIVWHSARTKDYLDLKFSISEC